MNLGFAIGMEKKHSDPLLKLEENLKNAIKKTKKLHAAQREERMDSTKDDAKHIMKGQRFGESDRDKAISAARCQVVEKMRTAFIDYIIRRTAKSLVRGEPGNFIHGLGICFRHKYDLEFTPEERRVFEGVIDGVQSAM